MSPPRQGALLALLIATFPTSILGQTSNLRIRAALVDDELHVVPLPQMDFRLISERGDTVLVRTDLDGLASQPLRPGGYLVESTGMVSFQGRGYRWSLPTTVTPAGAYLELTARNSTPASLPTEVGQQAAPRAGRRRVSEEAQVFESVRTGVFTIFADGRKGSGFLVDRRGIVLTNAHVVEGASEVRVQIDSTTVVRARLIERDPERDVAVLLVPPTRCTGCAVLPIAQPESDAYAVPGERILAIGSPLNQTSVLTLGIVSRVEERAIISDVNINPGNSGGPMLNTAGEVIGINTFADPNRQGSGPGVAGAVLIAQALPAVLRARGRLEAGEASPPADSLLPIADRRPYPLVALQEIARQPRYNLRNYSGRVGGFDLFVMTPPASFWRQAQAERALLGRRERREVRAGVEANERVDPIQNWPGWDEYVGGRRPVVMINVLPRAGETRGSGWLNALGAIAAGAAGTVYVGHSELEFKGDFRDLRLMRDGQEVVPVERNRVGAPLDLQTWYASGRDYAHQGIYVFRPEDFGPRPDGSFPTLVMLIDDTAHPGPPLEFTINPRAAETIWNDFSPFRASLSEPRP
jgi:S1-C subfamily serine protease